jgi:hypothetical protein
MDKGSEEQEDVKAKSNPATPTALRLCPDHLNKNKLILNVFQLGLELLSSARSYMSNNLGYYMINNIISIPKKA